MSKSETKLFPHLLVFGLLRVTDDGCVEAFV